MPNRLNIAIAIAIATIFPYLQDNQPAKQNASIINTTIESLPLQQTVKEMLPKLLTFCSTPSALRMNLSAQEASMDAVASLEINEVPKTGEKALIPFDKEEFIQGVFLKKLSI